MGPVCIKPYIKFWKLIISVDMFTSGLLGFAQKLHIKRGASDAMAKIAIVFLNGISGLMLLTLAMMSDAAVETLVLIRLLDQETLDTTSVSEAIQLFLDHVTWMFGR